jgi:diguanylate cyclase (GGDEF)-like protein
MVQNFLPDRIPEESERVDQQMFELAPVSLWLEDYSGILALFARWRQDGVVDLANHLLDPARVKECASRIRVIKVNQRTLDLFEAEGVDHLVGNLDRIFRDDMLPTHVLELVALWNGETEFVSQTVNYTLGGRRLDVQVKGKILPGYEQTLDRVLVAVQDVTERESARRRVADSERYARGLFEHSPISLWVEDFSAVKQLLNEVRAQGITDFRVFTDVHEEFITRCMREIRVIDVNQRTLELFAAPDRATLLRRIPDIFRDRMHDAFKEQMIDLWHGKLFQQREVVNYALSGAELYLLLQFSILPGHEEDWSLVQIALSDITARKKAEAYLEFLGKHDELTKLYNRSFYVDEINRLDHKGPHPVSIIVIDLNGLKTVNDQLGHAAGDALLRRMGEVLGKTLDPPCYAARIGGDEFALLLPDTTAEGAAAIADRLAALIDINNQFYSATKLAAALGLATALPGERLEAVIRRADERMYAAKRAAYRDAGGEGVTYQPPAPLP